MKVKNKEKLVFTWTKVAIRIILVFLSAFFVLFWYSLESDIQGVRLFCIWVGILVLILNLAVFRFKLRKEFAIARNVINVLIFIFIGYFFISIAKKEEPPVLINLNDDYGRYRVLGQRDNYILNYIQGQNSKSFLECRPPNGCDMPILNSQINLDKFLNKEVKVGGEFVDDGSIVKLRIDSITNY